MAIDWIEREAERPYHPDAALFPLLEGSEFDELKADIAANGLLEAIWLHPDGSIIDGRNRHRACIETETRPEFRTWGTGGSLVLFAASMNLHRRHLTYDQRVGIALKLEPVFAKEAKERMLAGAPAPISEQGRAAVEAAKQADVGKSAVYEMKAIQREQPDLADQLIAGDTTVQQTRRQLKERKREAIREENRKLVEQTPPLSEWDRQPAPTIVLDPPWDWGDEGDCDQFGRARPIYATMSFEEILALPVSDLAQVNAHIYLWITNRSLPKGFALLEAWGFRYITALTWCKPHFGMGNYFRGQTEHILFGIRGSLPLLRKDVGTWFAAPRPGEHSSKPDAFYELVERCSPGPWLEMFQRKPRPGWVGWGAEV